MQMETHTDVLRSEIKKIWNHILSIFCTKWYEECEYKFIFDCHYIGLPWWHRWYRMPAMQETHFLSFFFLGDPFLILGSGRSSGEGRGNPLQYSCLENSMDREAWQATVRGVSKSWTWLSDWHLHFHHCIKKLKRYTRIWKFGCLWEWQVGNGADRSRMGGHLFTVFFFFFK